MERPLADRVAGDVVDDALDDDELRAVNREGLPRLQQHRPDVRTAQGEIELASSNVVDPQRLGRSAGRLDANELLTIDEALMLSSASDDHSRTAPLAEVASSATTIPSTAMVEDTGGASSLA
jgi:hypothetical protein